MATEKDFREKSRMNWVATAASTTPNIEQVNAGSLQRIADATEIMASNYTKMQADLDYYKNKSRTQEEQIKRLKASLNTMKGVVTKAKKAAK